MTLSKGRLITVGALVFIVGLLLMFPARVAVHWFVPAEIQVGGISGTVWSGNAKEASVNGLYLHDLSWTMYPLRLFTGELSYHLTATPTSGFIETTVGLAGSGRVSLTGLTAALPLALFADATGVRGLKGSASFDFERVEIVDNLAVVSDGTLQVANLVIPVVSSSSLGGYKADFFTQNDGIGASVEETDGVVDLAGSLEINSDRSFRFIGQVIPTPKTPASMRQQLQVVSPANDRGQHEVRLEGIL